MVSPRPRRGRVWAIGSGAVVGLVVGFFTLGIARDQGLESPPPLPSTLQPDERNTIELFRRASASVVYITNTETRRDIFSLNVLQIPRGSGSGFVWDDQGHIVTNYHVIQGGDAFSVTLADGSQYDAKLVGSEPTKDLAVLEIDAPGDNLVPLVPGDSDHLVVGQKVLAIGNPFGLDQTLTTGIISALGREIKSVAGTTIQDVIQTDASINPGNSGGPLLDSSGRLIGVNTAIFSTSGSSAGIGFAVPVSTVMRVIPQLVRHGKVTRAGFGITLFPDNLVRRWGVQGVPIRQVSNGSAADKANLRGAAIDRQGRVRFGDIIVGIDGQNVQDFDDLFTALDQHEPGDRVRVRYRRGQQERETTIVLQAIQ